MAGRRTGNIAKSILRGSEYLLFRFNDVREADEFTDYLGSFDQLFPAELWVKGACVSEL